VVVAAGSGRRMGGTRAKQFLLLGGRPLLAHSLERLCGWPALDGLIVVAPASEIDTVTSEILPRLAAIKVLRVVEGGAERQDSVRNGLLALKEAAPDDLVLIHDGVRPFLPVEKLEELCLAARPHGAILAIPCKDTVKRVKGARITETLDRLSLVLAQTPQAFPFGMILMAHLKAKDEGFAATDDASVAQNAGHEPKVVEGVSSNLKVTTPEDLHYAERLSGERNLPDIRIGHGFDVHRLVPGRALVLGGVTLEHELGLLGHSDADVLVHAICDACLGAAGLGDIGRHFPDNEQRWKGADSLKLLAMVREKIEERGALVANVDATLIAEAPKIAPHIPQMEKNIAAALGVGESAVNVKATTTEKLGFTGRGEGMAAEAVALLKFP